MGTFLFKPEKSSQITNRGIAESFSTQLRGSSPLRCLKIPATFFSD
jgi:hypothetical protein